MNIFVTSSCPEQSAIALPDKLIVKMPLECCQLLSYIASPTFHNYGSLPKKDGTPYMTRANNGHMKHPCTLWGSQSIHNATWILYHGLMLCEEYQRRYQKRHACYDTLLVAHDIFPEGNLDKVEPFIRAMPDDLKLDKTIDTFTAYKKYIASKPWVSANYLRIPSRKPSWID